ncbi:MAG: MBOAT family O-acyltransferase, partial [Clostridium sp.]|nr:MBOAT family O-acyltransferase [Clostridium sp.]
KEFWRRWHITLGSWFKDYLYIPLGGNRKGKLRTYINIMIVFICSGLWHGASITFVLWGTLHGLFQVLGDIFKPLKEKLHKIFNINTNVFSYDLFQIIITFILVNFAWIFFRANSFTELKIILHNLFVFNPWMLTDGSLYSLGLESKEFFAAIIGIIILIYTDNLQTKGSLIDRLSKQNFLFRWSIYISTILIILIFGIYGPGYSDAQFIYFQF